MVSFSLLLVILEYIIVVFSLKLFCRINNVNSILKIGCVFLLFPEAYNKNDKRG